ncbi:uncharacterized protein LOC123519272 [Portunus trituberculatus]|uniref:uncharacterized protein LOC123519272 n=1 Tax=Portunus trituberculatus TaxID=210409 RepID=UPI001E1D1032|nr:uncharacterized protein LOC123519272 [Portunus trituberculatus]
MTAIHRSATVLLLALLCFSVAGQDAGGDTKAAKEPKSEGEVEAKGNDTTTTTNIAITGKNNNSKSNDNKGKTGDGSADDQGGKFFVNRAASTTTWTFLSSFTSIVPYTCYTTGMGDVMACMGRRLRRSRKMATDWEMNLDSTRLYGSNVEEEEEEEEPLESDRVSKEGKFFFRIWSTISTTATITTFSTNRSVTISVSILCTYPGITYNTC